jgi:hypothetical protein
MTVEHTAFLVGWALLGLWCLYLGATGLRALWRNHRGHRRPFDWYRDAPEYRCAKDAHVKPLP